MESYLYRWIQTPMSSATLKYLEVSHKSPTKGGILLQRLFPTFPSGWPGLGLLLLRGLLGFTLLAQSLVYIGSTDLSFQAWVVALLAVTSGAFLVVGFMTPIVALVVGLGFIGFAISSFVFSTPGLYEADYLIIDPIVVAIAVAFLGPGAFSLDARMFGRREIRIPATSQLHKPNA